MKYGHSLLLDSPIMAAELVHKDCERFQIVCPICREPTLKVEQEWPQGTRHYLAHYRKSPISDECELRVAAVPDADIKRAGGISFDQRIALFLRVLRDEIFRATAAHGGLPESALRRRHGNAFASRLMRALSRGMREFPGMRDLFSAPFVEDVLADYADLLPTRAQRDLQIKTARAVFAHLLSPRLEDQFRVLFANAWMVLNQRCVAAMNQPPPVHPISGTLLAHMRAIEESRGEAASRAVEQAFAARLRPEWGYQVDNAMQKILAEVAHEMIFILLCIPYLDVLKRQLAVRVS